MHYTVIALLSWIAGILSYPAACYVIYRQGISWGSLSATMIWSFVLFNAVFLVLYIPAYALIDCIHGRTAKTVGLAVAGVLLSLVPISFHLFMLGGLRVESYFSPEVILLYFLYGTAGLCSALITNYTSKARTK
jgi:hypothetical protein